MDNKQFDLESLNLLKLHREFKELLTVKIQYDIILNDNFHDNHTVLFTVFHRTSVKLAGVGHQSVKKQKL